MIAKSHAHPDARALITDVLDAELTGTAHAATADPDPKWIAAAQEQRWRCLVADGYQPTGVAVAWAMQHGGLSPVDTSPHTSFDGAGIWRRIRPLAYMNAPDSVLPDESRNSANHSIRLRVNGVAESGAQR